MNPIKVLITGVGGGSVGVQVMDALKMSKLGYFIVATNSEPNKTGLYEADKGYLIPSARDKKYLPQLLKICQKEKIRVIIPGSEPELAIISADREVFEKNKVLPLINSREVIEICQDKFKTMEFLKNNGLLFPRFAVLKSPKLPAGLKYPLVIKPAKGSGGSRNVQIIQNNTDLEFSWRYFTKQGLTPLVQEYIGSAREEYTVGVLADLEGHLIGSIALKREVSGNLSTALQIKDRREGQRDLLTISSGVSQGFVEDYPIVRKYAEKIAKTLVSRGPLNIQCRKVGSKIYTMEINPRFSGTSSIRALLGFNEPDILIRKYLLGQKPGKITYKKGLVLREFRMKHITFEQIKQIKSKKYIQND